MDNDSNGNLLNSLSEEQKKELQLAYEESYDEVKSFHEKWLKK